MFDMWRIVSIIKSFCLIERNLPLCILDCLEARNLRPRAGLAFPHWQVPKWPEIKQERHFWLNIVNFLHNTFYICHLCIAYISVSQPFSLRCILYTSQSDFFDCGPNFREKQFRGPQKIIQNFWLAFFQFNTKIGQLLYFLQNYINCALAMSAIFYIFSKLMRPSMWSWKQGQFSFFSFQKIFLYLLIQYCMPAADQESISPMFLHK